MERVAAVSAEYADTKLLSEKDAIVLVQAFLTFTGNLLKPPSEMVIFFGGDGKVDAEMDTRHAWMTLLFTEAGNSAMLEGARAMELESLSCVESPDVSSVMVETLRKGELSRLLKHSLQVVPESCWLTPKQRQRCLNA